MNFCKGNTPAHLTKSHSLFELRMRSMDALSRAHRRAINRIAKFVYPGKEINWFASNSFD